MTGLRLNGIIRAWESGKPAVTCFAQVDKLTAQEMTDAPFDDIVLSAPARASRGCR